MVEMVQAQLKMQVVAVEVQLLWELIFQVQKLVVQEVLEQQVQ
tara:strand:+ start:375 stop:503 length:129 start_codon:yes stop_codon:yes gene_type:complete